MKYCLTENCSKDLLKEVDEIKTYYSVKNKNKIYNLIEEYPNKTIIIEHYDNDEIDTEELFSIYNELNILSRGKIIIDLIDMGGYPYVKKYNIPFYFSYLATSEFELRAIASYKPVYVKVGAPLFFNMPSAAAFNIPIRVEANNPIQDPFLREDLVCGSWIRPEDQDLYEPFISTIEFLDPDRKKAEAAYRVYAHDKKWPVDLGILIKGLNYPGQGTYLPEEFGKTRLNCGQSCMATGNCKLCYRHLNISQMLAEKYDS